MFAVDVVVGVVGVHCDCSCLHWMVQWVDWRFEVVALAWGPTGR